MLYIVYFVGVGGGGWPVATGRWRRRARELGLRWGRRPAGACTRNTMASRLQRFATHVVGGGLPARNATAVEQHEFCTCVSCENPSPPGHPPADGPQPSH